MTGTAGHSAPQLDTDVVRHKLSAHDVGAALVAAGVPGSHRQIILYCEVSKLDAAKIPGPTGEQLYVAAASAPKVILDLRQWEGSTAEQSQKRHALDQIPKTYLGAASQKRT